MAELTEEQTKKLFDSMQCNDCSKQLILSPYVTTREGKLVEALGEEGAYYVCLAFAESGIAEIGPFGGIGCECFEKQNEDFSIIKEAALRSIKERVFDVER